MAPVNEKDGVHVWTCPINGCNGHGTELTKRKAEKSLVRHVEAKHSNVSFNNF